MMHYRNAVEIRRLKPLKFSSQICIELTANFAANPAVTTSMYGRVFNAFIMLNILMYENIFF